jgi:hypothetical protein
MLADPSPIVRGADARALSDLSQPQNWFLKTDDAQPPTVRTFTDIETKATQALVKNSLQPLLKDEDTGSEWTEIRQAVAKHNTVLLALVLIAGLLAASADGQMMKILHIR